VNELGLAGLVALGAAVGAPLRYVVSQRLDGEVPLGTFAVNVVGSFVLGLVTALGLGGHAVALLGTGFCGGFTTYSSFAVQTHRLASTSRRTAAAYAVGTLGAALAACALGFALGAGPLE